MKETYDIKVQVAKSDDSGLVDNDLTQLNQENNF